MPCTETPIHYIIREIVVLPIWMSEQSMVIGWWFKTDICYFLHNFWPKVICNTNTIIRGIYHSSSSNFINNENVKMYKMTRCHVIFRVPTAVNISGSKDSNSLKKYATMRLLSRLMVPWWIKEHRMLEWNLFSGLMIPWWKTTEQDAKVIVFLDFVQVNKDSARCFWT